jgi:hypothetical protein
MFFTHLGRVVAILGLVLGALMILIETMRLITISSLPEYVERFSHQGIEQGIYMVLVGLVLFILTDIRYALGELSKKLDLDAFLRRATSNPKDQDK